MRNLTAALLAATLATAPIAAPAAEAPGAVPMAFVEQFSDDHLSGMLSRIGGQNAALRALAEFDGQSVAVVFDAQIDAAVREYSEQWAHNMALAWDPLLTDDEMQSLLDEAADSPFADKYVANRETAAASMAGLSGALFGQILEQVIGATVKRLLPDAPETGAPGAGAPAK